jgi:histidinol-phosphatase
MSPDLELAHRLADTADAISLDRFRARDLVVRNKADATPVTEADTAVEEAIREVLTRERPGDAILGEEHGVTGDVTGNVTGNVTGRAGRRWIVDPIDGTRNYSRGVPVWATLIALEEDGEVRLGVVSAPALGRRWWAERGAGAHADGDRVHVSAIRDVEDAVLCFALEQPLPGLAHRAWHARAYGDFWAHMLVAEGAADGAIDAVGVSLWDLAAVQVIVEEAGGTFTDFTGTRRADGGSAISSNGRLHEVLLDAVAPLIPKEVT